MRKPKTIETLAQFEATLDSAQRSFFLQRETERDLLFQKLLQDAARVLSHASTLVGESTSERLARESNLTS
jgi:hypothetical protein